MWTAPNIWHFVLFFCIYFTVLHPHNMMPSFLPLATKQTCSDWRWTSVMPMNMVTAVSQRILHWRQLLTVVHVVILKHLYHRDKVQKCDSSIQQIGRNTKRLNFLKLTLSYDLLTACRHEVRRNLFRLWSLKCMTHTQYFLTLHLISVCSKYIQWFEGTFNSSKVNENKAHL